jgi:hypothetical protein
MTEALFSVIIGCNCFIWREILMKYTT